jgi:ribosomal protein S18 acetylase RimI-like enzyme
VPEGYRIATAAELQITPEAWADLINRCFDNHEVNWTAETVLNDYVNQVQYDSNGAFFGLKGDQPVSTAFAWLDKPEEAELGRIHWVGSLPECRGTGMGRAVVVSIMHYFRDRGFQRVMLGTHKHMLAAISLYMSLGLEPMWATPEEEAEWALALEALGRKG